MNKWLADLLAFRKYSYYRKSLYCFAFKHIPRSRRMLGLALIYYKNEKQDNLRAKKSGVIILDGRIIRMKNLYECLQRLYYLNEVAGE